MLKAFRVPLTWADLLKRTANEVVADNCLGLAAQLAFYFFLALFPALLFFVALASFLPVSGLMDAVMASLARVAPVEVLSIVRSQMLAIAHEKNGGLLTLGMLGTIWSTSSGVNAIIETLNQAYDIQEARPWWKVRLRRARPDSRLWPSSSSRQFSLVLIGPTAAEHVIAAAGAPRDRRSSGRGGSRSGRSSSASSRWRWPSFITSPRT